MAAAPIAVKEDKQSKELQLPKQTTTQGASGNTFLITPKEALQEARRRLREATNDTERLAALEQIRSIYQTYWGSQQYPFTHEDTRAAIEDICNYALKQGYSDAVRHSAMFTLTEYIVRMSNGMVHSEDFNIFLSEMTGIAQSSGNSHELRLFALSSFAVLMSLPKSIRSLLISNDSNYNTLMSCAENLLSQNLPESLLSKCAEFVGGLSGLAVMEKPGGFYLPNQQRLDRLLWCINRLVELAPNSEPVFDRTANAFLALSEPLLSAKEYLNISSTSILAFLSRSYDIATQPSHLQRIQAGSVLLAAGFLNPKVLNAAQLGLFQLDAKTILRIREEVPGRSGWEWNTWKMAGLSLSNQGKSAIRTLFENYNTVQFGHYDLAVLGSMLNNLHTKTGKPILFAIITRKPDGIFFAGLFKEGDLANFDIRMIEAKHEDEVLAYMGKVASNLGIKPYSQDRYGEKFSVFGVHGHGQPERIGLGKRPEVHHDEKYYLDITDKDLAKKIGKYFTWEMPNGQVFRSPAYFYACATTGSTGTISNNVAETWAENARMRLFGAQLPFSEPPILTYELENRQMTLKDFRCWYVNRNSYDYRNTTSLSGDFTISQEDLSIKIGFNFTEVQPASQFILEGYDIQRSSDGGKTFKRVGFVPAGQQSFLDSSPPLGNFTYRIKQRWYKNVGDDGAGTYDESRDYQFGFSQGKTIEIQGVPVPTELSLYQNYPNPFNAATNIHYYLPKSGKVTMNIYDVTGREIASLVSRNQKIGHYYEVFNASSLASGTYFCRLVLQTKGETTTQSTKMVLVK